MDGLLLHGLMMVFPRTISATARSVGTTMTQRG